jgi:hypothetical protein
MAFHLHNMMTCENLGASIGGSCSMSWLFGAVLFLALAFSRKWVFEQMSLGFNLIVAEIVGVVSFMIAVGVIGMPNISLLIGLACGLAAGYFSQNMVGSEDSGDAGDA